MVTFISKKVVTRRSLTNTTTKKNKETKNKSLSKLTQNETE